MVAQNIFFGIIAVLMIVAALRVVTARNVVHAALWLVLVMSGLLSERHRAASTHQSRHPQRRTRTARLPNSGRNVGRARQRRGEVRADEQSRSGETRIGHAGQNFRENAER